MKRAKKKVFKLQRDPNDYLTGREHHVLRLLTEGKTYSDIAATIGITPTCLHVHCHRIRLKTGIKDTGDFGEVRQWLETYRPRLCEPSKLQLQIIREHYINGLSHYQIALLLDINPETSRNQMRLGIRRWGITSRGDFRRAQIRGLLASMDQGQGDPMSEDIFN